MLYLYIEKLKLYNFSFFMAFSICTKLSLVGILSLFVWYQSAYSQILLKDKLTVKDDIIKIHNDTIYTCELSNHKIVNQLDVYNCIFAGKANFENSIFFKNTSFDGSLFLTKANFLRATFLDNVSFGENYYAEDAFFFQAKFSKGVSLTRGIYFKDANFYGSSFSQKVEFYGSSFKKSANFNNAVFEGEVEFSNITFTGLLSFKKTTFFEPPNFNESQISDSLDFSEVRLQNLKSDIFFNTVRLDSLRKRTGDKKRKCKINLYHTDLSKIVIDYDKFSISFDSLLSNEERISIYQQLIKKCRDLGMESSAQGFDIDLQKIKTLDSWRSLSPLVVWFQTYWWNFGYDRSLIIRNIFLAFLSSFIIFFFGFNHFMKAYFPVEELGLSQSQVRVIFYTRSPFSQLKNRTKVVFFYTSLVFFGLKLDHTKVKYRQYPGASIVIYAIYAVGLIHLAYLAAFIIVDRSIVNLGIALSLVDLW